MTAPAELMLLTPVPWRGRSQRGRAATKTGPVGSRQKAAIRCPASEALRFVRRTDKQSTGWIEFSKDGQWVAFILSPGYTLWCSKPGGSERQQLSFPPMQVFGSYLSPDDRQIATNVIVGDRKGIFLFPTEAGGKPEQLTSENPHSGILGWSADGTSLFICRESESGTLTEPAFYVLDLKTRQASRLRGSEGLHDGLVSPNGKYAAALNEDDKSVVLYDLHTHQQSELAQGVGLYYVWWAHDGKAVFFQDILEGSDTPIYRVQIDNHRVGARHQLRPTVRG